jgi:hypothetical protein
MKKQRLGMGWLIPGAVMLANPVVAFYDILPDCIGYLLVCVALFRLADLNSYIADALKRFRTLIWVSMGGLLMQYFIYNVLAKQPGLKPQEIPTMVLLCSFVIAVPQIYFAVPAWRDLFRGFWQLAERHGGQAVFHYGKRNTNLCERMRRASGVLVVLLALLPILPEFSVLTTFEYEFEKLPFDWYQFIWLFRVTAIMVLTVLFLVWFVRLVRFLLLFTRDGVMMDSIIERYEQDILPQGDMLSLRRLRFGIVFLVIGAALTVNICIEEKILVPSILCALFVVIGVLIFGTDLKDRKPFFLSAGALGVLSIAELCINNYYTTYYSYELSGWDPTAYRLFLGLRATQVAEAFLAAWTFYLLLDLFSAFIKERVFEKYRGNDTAELSARATERLHKSFGKKIVACKILFFAAAAAIALESIFQLEHPWLWWISVPTVIASTVTFATFLYALLDHLVWQSNAESTHKEE